LKLLGSKPVAGSSLNSALECNRASKINVLEGRGGFWGTFILQDVFCWPLSRDTFSLLFK